MTRNFGAINSAGTRIEEQSGQQTIAPSALGFAGFAALLEKGPVGELMIITSRALFDRRCGGIIDDSLAPDACRDFYSIANGAGGLCLIRVTDGNERVATAILYARDADSLVPMGRINAANGGRWGGKKQILAGELDAETDLSEFILQLPAAVATNYTTNELKGGYIELEGVPNTRYTITGNTAAGLVSVESDSTMRADLIAATATDPPTELNFYITLENEEKEVSILIDDGAENKSTEFSLQVLVDGVVVKTFPNLHTDPTNARYWVKVINDAGDNYEIEAVDLFTGGHTPAVRPANHYANVASVAANVLTAEIANFTIGSPGGGDPTLTLGTTNDDHVAQTITIVMSSPTAGTVVSDKFGALGAITLGTLFDVPNAGGGATVTNKWVPPFTVTAGGSPLAAADVLIINYRPVPLGLAGQKLYANKTDDPNISRVIASNTHNTITVATGVDLSSETAAGKDFMVSAPTALANGRDGNADIADTDYINQAWDVNLSPFNNTRGKSLGLIKYATPGVTSTAVQKAGVSYAEAKNHQYRYEIPSGTVDDISALEYVTQTLGRSDYAKVSYPSYGEVSHPDPDAAREGRTKLVSLTGKFLGREARVAGDNLGYHRVAAGTIAKLDGVLDIPTGDRLLDEELLNPAGINIVKKSQGNFVMWGARTLSISSEWQFSQKRELMSYYEQVFIESFDFILFSINDSASDALARTAFIEFFRPEFAKSAIRGTTLTGGDNPALILKIDNDLNTDAVRAAGNKIAELSLQLADVTERFIIRIGQKGVFSSVA